MRDDTACFYCDKEATILCDYPVWRPGVGRATCDRPCCDEHSKLIWTLRGGGSIGMDETRDYCDEHRDCGKSGLTVRLPERNLRVIEGGGQPSLPGL